MGCGEGATPPPREGLNIGCKLIRQRRKIGLPLSKIHHAAFDSHLIGIDPDFRVHVARRLRDLRDGPMLELLKQTHGARLHLPPRERDCPDRDRLARRFDVFRGYD